MKWFLVLIIFSARNTAAQMYSPDSVISVLVDDIEKDQIKEKGEFFPGMFYSFRGAAAPPHRFKPDNNIFFTAIGSFTLKHLSRMINQEQQTTVYSVLERSKRAFPSFQQKDGLPLYNFWPRGGKIMPHSFIAQHMSKQFKISEDADDTVMILMALQNNDSINAILKKRLMEVSNGGTAGKKIKSTFKRFRNYQAYTTYLGYNMQTDFDFAVQCNVLYFMYNKGIFNSHQDSASLQLLSEMVKERLYMKRPKFISPYYGHPSLLLYHLTRLIAAYHPKELAAYQATIKEDLHLLYSKATTPVEKIILQTSLLRMGENAEIPTEREIQEIRLVDQHKFSFFQARPAYWCRPFLKSLLLHLEFVNYHFFSPTYDKILLLENLAMRKAINPPAAFR